MSDAPSVASKPSTTAPTSVTLPAISDMPAGAVAGALAAGAVAAVTVVGHPPGLGVALAVLATAVVIANAARRRLGWFSWTLAAAAVVLGIQPLLLDAEWVVALAMTGAACLAVLAVLEPATWRQMVQRAVDLVPVGVLAPLAFGRTVMRVGSDGRGRAASIARTAALSLVLLLLFGALFNGADAAFAVVVERLVPDLRLGLWSMRAFVGVTCALFVAVCVLGLAVRPSPKTSARRPPRATLEWAVPLGLLDGLFASFVVLQLIVRMAGRQHVLTTAGVTYAQYAREGFFQLLMVVALTLIVVAWAPSWAGAVTGRQLHMLRLLLGVLCLLALVVAASALHRLELYEAAFGFTRLRFMVHAVIWWLAALLVAVLVLGCMRRTSLLFRVIVLVTAVFAVGFVTVRPDAVIAVRNVERWQVTGRIDTGYLGSMSTDAVPTIRSLPAGLSAPVVDHITAMRPAARTWLSFNVSRVKAGGGP
jgi:two-component system sensor histidine kinase BaeS